MATGLLSIETVIEILRARFIGGQMLARIMDEDVCLVIAEVKLDPKSVGDILVAGVTWKKPEGGMEWLESVNDHFSFDHCSYKEGPDGTATADGDRFPLSINFRLLPVGHPDIVVGFAKATATLEELLQQHKSLKLIGTADGPSWSMTGVMTPDGKRIGIVRLDYTCRWTNVFSTGITRVRVEEGTVIVNGWFKGKDGDMAHGSRPIEGHGSTFFEAVANAYEN